MTVNFYHRVRSKVSRYLKKRSLGALMAEYQRTQPEDLKEVEQVLALFRSNGGLNSYSQSFKLIELKRLLQEYKPQNILELGSGSSTAIFARYVAQSSAANLTTVDESEYWLKNSKRLAGAREGDAAMNFKHCPKVFRQSSSAGLEIKYDFSDFQDFDFVFVDGPSNTQDDEKRPLAVNTNVWDLIQAGHYPRVIVLDVRKATVDFLRRELREKYKCIESDYNAGRYDKGSKYFTVFELRLN